jgi:hypothetical protein
LAGYQSQLSHPLLSPYLLTGTALTKVTTPFTSGERESSLADPHGGPAATVCLHSCNSCSAVMPAVL